MSSCQGITKEGVHHMCHLIAIMGRLSVWMCKRSMLAAGLGLFILSGAAAQDVTVTEQTFGCILDWPKVRNTYPW